MSATLNKPRATARDFFRLPEGTLAQLIDAEVIMSPAPKTFHQQIIQNLSITLGTYIRKKKAGKLFTSPIDVYFSENEVYQPDALFMAKENLSKIKDWGIEGAPDLVIEVLSVSTAYYDLTHKKRVYEDFQVKEYLIIDPMEQTAELFVQDNGNGFSSRGLLRTTGEVAFQTLPGLTLTLAEIFDSGL